MLEALAIDLVAGGLAGAGSVGIGKVRDILRRNRFSSDVDDLTTEFSSALKTSLSEAVSGGEYDEIEGIEANWTTITEELDSLDITFENGQEAVARVTDAVATGLDVDLQTNPLLRESLEAAVADAYRTSLREFADRIAGTHLAEVFNTETNIELAATVNRVENQLGEISRQIRSQRTATLRNAGITWLDPLYFERHEAGDPETAWRTGFDFAEVDAGYPLPRERPPRNKTDERHRLSDEIITRMDEGEDLVVLGDGGVGKSTVCKHVACQWHADSDRGPVFYRSSTSRTQFDEPGSLIEAIRNATADVLVVVEDAASETTAPIYEVLGEFEDTTEVSILLDSRKSAWRDDDELAGAPRFKHQRQRLGVVNLPSFDPTECNRSVNHYESLTGEDVGQRGEQLHERVRSAAIGQALVLAYELTGPSTEVTDEMTVSALHDDVHRAYRTVDRWAEGELSRAVPLMVNVLNAADLPVDEALIHALATDVSENNTIERAVGFIEGTILLSGGDGVRTPHATWSLLYLERFLESEGERVACHLFERCVDALFRFCDDSTRRDDVASWLRDRPNIITQTDKNPSERAGEFVTRIADIGRERPGVGILFSTPQMWSVSLPASCPPEAETIWYLRRGMTRLSSGDLGVAEAEFEHGRRTIEADDGDTHETTKGYQSLFVDNLGNIARKRGDLDTAEEYHKESLAIERDLGDRHGEAQSLANLGIVAYERGDLDTAEKYHEECLTIEREFDDRHGEAQSLGSLGNVAYARGDLDTAEKYHKESLAISRELGDRYGEARSLGNLGIVACERGDLATAEEYHEESLAIKRELNDRYGEAQSLNHLGRVARRRGDLDIAETHTRNSVDIGVDIGAFPWVFDGIDHIIDVFEQKDSEEQALRWCDRAIDIAEDIDDDDTRDQFESRRSELCG